MHLLNLSHLRMLLLLEMDFKLFKVSSDLEMVTLRGIYH